MKTGKIFSFVLLFALMICFTAIVSQKIYGQKIVNNVYHLTDLDFDKTIKNGVVLVDFWAVWCGPCKMQAPIIDELALEMGEKVVIAKINTDAARAVSARYNIRYIPTIIIFKNGVPVERLVGLQSKETLLNSLNNHLK